MQLLNRMIIFFTLSTHVTMPFAHAEEPAKHAEAATETAAVESDTSGGSVFARAWQGGFIVFTVLLTLMLLSVATWGVVIFKYLQLRKTKMTSDAFVKSFWDSKSLNELNGKLNDFPYSPAREVFRTGYAELVRGNQLKEQSSHLEIAISASLDNLNRSLSKARNVERRRLENLISLMAISASACPFIGLFGTVWGIMNSFEGIAKSGSTSLAAVAPGISEALTATALGLAAAIPAVVGYNLCAALIRHIVSSLENFGSDFMNIVERYLVTDKGGSKSSANVHS